MGVDIIQQFPARDAGTNAVKQITEPVTYEDPVPGEPTGFAEQSDNVTYENLDHEGEPGNAGVQQDNVTYEDSVLTAYREANKKASKPKEEEEGKKEVPNKKASAKNKAVRT